MIYNGIKDMREQGYISEEEESVAKTEEVKFIERQKTTIKAPYFVFWIEQQLSRKYGQNALQTQGLQVYTSLDMRLQDIAEKVVWDGVKVNAKKYNAHNAALVAMDPRTGEVLAMVGGKDYFAPAEPEGCKPGKTCVFEPNVNVADSARQPGSSFKPYTYLTAFGKDFALSPASVILDTPITYGGTYSPKNYNGGYSGRVSIRKALAGSLNVPAVKVLNQIGIDSVVDMAHSLGITAPLKNCGLSMTLGSCEVKLIDHVTAYSTIAAGGVYQGTCGVIKIVNLKGEEIQSCPKENKQVVDPQAVYELESIMTDNDSRAYVFGKSSPLAFKDRPVAAKTGTTDLWKDGWTMGFTPSLTVGVWTGNNNGTLMKAGADGVFVAAPIWRAFMDQALAGSPAEQFWKPQAIKDLTSRDVPASLRGKYIFTKKTEVFADYAVPKVEPPKPKPIAQAPKPAEPSKPAEPAPLIANPVPEISVAIKQPQSFASVSRYPFAIKVEASQPDQVAHMEAYLDGKFLQTISGKAFNFSILQAPEPGVHTIMVIATDLQGRTSSDSVSVSFGAEDLRP
jgi:membrane peptidoglycan carboxypeptidase